MKKYYVLAALAMTALFTACSNEDDPSNMQTTPVSFKVNKEVTTRSVTSAGDDGKYKTVFTEGESIGVYGAENNKNVKYTFSSSTDLSSDNPITIYDSQDYTFYAYSPYSVGNAASVSFSVNEDQTTETNFNASNFLTGTGTHAANAGNSVALTFEPKLALVYINVSGPVGDNTTAVTINNVHKSITWTPGSNPTTVTDDEVASVKMRKPTSEQQVYVAFVPAQTITSGTNFLSFNVGAKQYVYKPSANVDLEAGSRNIFNVTIGESTINLVATVAGEATWSDTTPSSIGWSEVEEYNYITMPTDGSEIPTSTNTSNDTPGWWCNGLTSVSYTGGVFTYTGAIQNPGWSAQTLFYYSNEKLPVGKYELTLKAKTSAASKNMRVAFYDATNKRFFGIGSDSFVWPSNTVTATGGTYKWIIDLGTYRAVSSLSVGSGDTAGTPNTESELNGFRLGIHVQNETFTVSDIKLVRAE